MVSITVNNTKVIARIIRSARQRIQVRVISSEELEVRAPLDTPDSAIMALLRDRYDWLTAHLAEASRPFSLKDPQPLLFFGKEVPLHLRVSDNGKFDASYSETEFILTHPPDASKEEIRNAIIAYYRYMGRTILAEKTALWAKRMGVTYKGIAVKEQKTSWATCSSQKNLNYNWRILQASDELIDSLVIHELCHLRHMNHSKAFWQMVAKFNPNYAEHDDRLNRLAFRLMTSLH
ncbi:MAG: M48 family metallopeptidase [Selenomonadales bacterium]|nr:M48 family metallopeptidase [Selenomonadales bacterium]